MALIFRISSQYQIDKFKNNETFLLGNRVKVTPPYPRHELRGLKKITLK